MKQLLKDFIESNGDCNVFNENLVGAIFTF